MAEVERAQHDQVVVAREAEISTRLDLGTAFVRPWAVADEIAETPQLVRLVGGDRGEDRVESVLVTVHVRDDGDPLAQGWDLSARRRGVAPLRSAPLAPERAR